MTSTTARVLDVIDAGLQSSDEHGYGTDTRPDRCARCQRHEPEDGDLCGGCRAFLLEDSDADPAQFIRDEVWAAAARRAATGVCHYVVTPRGESAHVVLIDEAADFQTVADLGEPMEDYLDFRRHTIQSWARADVEHLIEGRRAGPFSIADCGSC